MKKLVNTINAPAAIGPYSQAMALENLIFTSGQLPLNPETMNIVEGGISAQTHQALANLKAILDSCGASLDTVLKTTCFLADMDDFATFNLVYAEFFGNDNTPARSCFAVAKLPKGALVEVEAIAYLNK